MTQGCRPRWPPSIGIGPGLHPDAPLTASVPSLTAVPGSDRSPSGIAIACTERSGDHLTNSVLHNNAGFYALMAGDVPAARAHLDAAAQVGQQIGYQNAALMANLGQLLRAEGGPDGARSCAASKPT